MGVGRSAVIGRDEQDEIPVKRFTLRHRTNRVRCVRVFRTGEAASWLGAPPGLLSR
jgi:hypothetical protein